MQAYLHTLDTPLHSLCTDNYPNRAELCHKLNIKVCLFVFYQKMSLSHNYQVTTNLKKIANLCQLNAFLG